MSEEPTTQPSNPVESIGLLGCPFCDRKIFEDGMILVNLQFTFHGGGPPPSYSLCCGLCGAEGPAGLGEHRDDHKGAQLSAIKKWNDRATHQRTNESPRLGKNTMKKDTNGAEPQIDSQLDCSVSNREKLDYMIEIMISNASVRTLKGRMVHEKDACHIAKKIMDLAIDVAVSEVKQNELK